MPELIRPNETIREAYLRIRRAADEHALAVLETQLMGVLAFHAALCRPGKPSFGGDA